MKKALICGSSMVVLQLLSEFAMLMFFWDYEVTELNVFPFDLFLGVFSFWGFGILLISIFYRFIKPMFKTNPIDKQFLKDILFYMKMRVLFMICAVGIGFSVKILSNPTPYFTEGSTFDLIQGNRHAFMNDYIHRFIYHRTFYLTYLPLILIFGWFIYKHYKNKKNISE